METNIGTAGAAGEGLLRAPAYYGNDRLRLISFLIWTGFIVAHIAALFIVGLATGSVFASARALEMEFEGMLFLAIPAVAVAAVFSRGGFDLSIGSVGALAAFAAASMLMRGAPLFPAILAALGIGLACGLLNAVFVRISRVPGFMVTIATMFGIRYLCFVLMEAQSVTLEEGPAFSGFLIAAVVVLAVASAAAFLLYQVPGWMRKRTAESGPLLPRVLVMGAPYIVSGLLAAFTGLLTMSYIGAATPTLGNGWEIDVVVAVILGGCLYAGGSANIAGVLAASFLVSCISAFAMINNVSQYVLFLLKPCLIFYGFGAMAVLNAVMGAVYRKKQGAPAA